MNGKELDFAKSWFVTEKENSKAYDLKIVQIYRRFISSWISLVFIGRYYTDIPAESDIVTNVVQNIPTVALDKFVERNSDRIRKFDNLRVENVGNRSPWKRADDFKDAINLGNSKEIVEKLIGLLYAVRCNLFHGRKTWDDKRDNEVMELASFLVTDLVDSILNDKSFTINNS